MIFFPSSHCKSGLSDLHYGIDNIPLGEGPGLLPIGGIVAHSNSVAMTKVWHCWWLGREQCSSYDCLPVVVMAPDCKGHKKSESLNKPVFAENHKKLFLVSQPLQR